VFCPYLYGQLNIILYGISHYSILVSLYILGY